MGRRSLRYALSALGLGMHLACAHAQDVSAPQQATDGGRRLLQEAPTATWEQVSHSHYRHGLDIATVTNTDERHKCGRPLVTSDRIVCRHVLAPDEIFSRADVAALYERQSHAGQVVAVLLTAGLTGGNVYWMVLLAGAGPLGIAATIPVGAFALLWAEGAVLAATDDGGVSRVVYRKPEAAAIAAEFQLR